MCEDGARTDANYLFAELVERVAKAPVTFKIPVQAAGPGDVVVDDATISWPEDASCSNSAPSR